MTFTPPAFESEAFHCPRCGTHAHMEWRKLTVNGLGHVIPWYAAQCSRCTDFSVWKDGVPEIMLDPPQTTAPPPHPSMPASCIADYDEARAIAARSPRGAAALLRLVVQKLCIALEQKGENINDDIKALVQAGLPVDAQQALDVLRVTGNNAVHPGEMDIEGNPQLVAASFELINFIVDQQIAQKERIAKLFSALPDRAKNAIKKRDGN
ncbi:hypothetical protein LMG26858_02327 [Achromobacter anxifer]|uniref:DUF4145 domain-containing protein n=1 Tax=Achromobacter anxifer TaxID=1287737 RepID=A0A6S7CTR1_9BURK|nr:DUF4145 domain-containing protein [Achromobacter anxifer]CAB3863124.1 hypothetical protein LMG26858_02327 [Achromobacter anxifer]